MAGSKSKPNGKVNGKGNGKVNGKPNGNVNGKVNGKVKPVTTGSESDDDEEDSDQEDEVPVTKLNKRSPKGAPKGGYGKSPGAKTKPDGPPLSELKAKAKAALRQPSMTEEDEAALKVRGLNYYSLFTIHYSVFKFNPIRFTS